ncbi:MAG: GumC family protein [Spirulina sp.]
MDIQQYWFVLKRRWWPASLVFVTVSTLTVMALNTQHNIYQAEGKIRFTPEDRTSALTGLGVTEGTFHPLVDSNNPMTTEMAVIRSEPVIQTTLARLNSIRPQGQPLSHQDLQKKLVLTTLRGTDILLLSFQDADPALAATVVDTVMQTYLDNHVRENRMAVMMARSFIEAELPGAEAQVQQAEAALRRFQEAHQVAALEEEKVAVVTAAEALRQRVAEAASALQDTSEQSRTFSQQLGMSPQEAIAVTTLSQSPGVQTVLAQYQEVESQLANERVRYYDDSPVVQSLLSRRANLEALLHERIADTLGGQSLAADNLQIGELQAALAGDLARTEAARQGLAKQLETLQQAQSYYTQRLATLPRLEQEHRELMRRLDAAQGTYALLLERLHETRIAENQTLGNAHIVQEAVVLPHPVAPRKLSFLATGGIVALLLAAATALGLEMQDNLVKTAREARQLFDLPLLGVIPLHRVGGRGFGGSRSQASVELIVRDLPGSPISESYRMLQANLAFLNSDRAVKTVVVTSSMVGEGKSVVSANLAMARAQQGRRVLLIDADMRCPRQHQLWGLVNDRGLSNLLAERWELSAVVKPLTDHLDLLTAGVIPPNPTALLDSQRMATVLAQVAADYDFVVLDTPALNVAADVHILGRLSQGIVLVTRPGVLDVGSAQVAKERLAQFGALVLGQVINGVVPDHEPDSYYYFAGAYTERQGADPAPARVTA